MRGVARNLQLAIRRSGNVKASGDIAPRPNEIIGRMRIDGSKEVDAILELVAEIWGALSFGASAIASRTWTNQRWSCARAEAAFGSSADCNFLYSTAIAASDAASPAFLQIAFSAVEVALSQLKEGLVPARAPDDARQG
jgi:hypothetical protein